uniref:VWFA domain-containing protein n=1 Tax=Laticauda laticaudata TaxID=8630 RepID=A0A8C5RXZ6_LATLA
SLSSICLSVCLSSIYLVLVGAPFETGRVNEMGKLYQCTYPLGDCKEISIQRPRDAFNMSFGLTLVAQNDQVLVCGPMVHRACGENTYVNGYCFLLDQNLQEKEHFPESLPECTRHPTDIAFLIDGSSSISEEDFEKMKQFVSEVIKNLSGGDTLFALMQFSGNFREHFNFNSQDPAQLVMEVKQLYGWTKTATAIRKVLYHHPYWKQSHAVGQMSFFGVQTFYPKLDPQLLAI